jgi:hypothetical protein
MRRSGAVPGGGRCRTWWARPWRVVAGCASAGLALFSVCLAPGQTAAAGADTSTAPCTATTSAPRLVTIGSAGVSFDASGAGATGGRYGYYALPPHQPAGIVAVAHGYQQTAWSMAEPGEYTSQGLLESLAADDGVIALAMDNSGEQDSGPGSASSRGWDVVQGAADLARVARLFDAQCQPAGGPPLRNTLFGVSMGGDTSGIAAASGATTVSGAPLFRYWFDVSGVTDVAETWLEATAASPALAYAAQASADIEAEFGGTPLQQPAAYAAASPALVAGRMRASGIEGAVVLHAVMDGLVTSDEGDQMLAALQGAGIPTDFYTAVFQEPGASSATIDGDLLGLAAPGYRSPFAGHVDGIIMDSALARLAALYRGGQAPQGLSVTLSDGKLGTVALLRLQGT